VIVQLTYASASGFHLSVFLRRNPSIFVALSLERIARLSTMPVQQPPRPSQ